MDDNLHNSLHFPFYQKHLEKYILQITKQGIAEIHHPSQNWLLQIMGMISKSRSRVTYIIFEIHIKSIKLYLKSGQ